MIFDYKSGEFIHILSDNMAINSDGDLMMKLFSLRKKEKCCLF